jgi:hypothetical protein
MSMKRLLMSAFVIGFFGYATIGFISANRVMAYVEALPGYDSGDGFSWEFGGVSAAHYNRLTQTWKFRPKTMLRGLWNGTYCPGAGIEFRGKPLEITLAAPFLAVGVYIHLNHHFRIVNFSDRISGDI